MTLTCIECQKQLGADPQTDQPEVIAHLKSCPQCADFKAQMQRQDELFIRAIETDFMASSPSAGSTQTLKKAAPRYAIAAAISILCLSAVLVWQVLQPPALADQLVAHIGEEPQSLTAANGAADSEQLQKVLAAAGLRLRPGHETVINYVMLCDFNGQKIVHLVVASDHGPVTVLLMTEDQNNHPSKRFHSQGFDGLITQAPRGSIALLSQRGDLYSQARKIMAAIDYQTG